MLAEYFKLLSVWFLVPTYAYSYLNRECLGPIVGGALIYKVGFRSTAAVSHVFNICTYITVQAFDILPSLMPVVDITIQVRIHGFLV